MDASLLPRARALECAIMLVDGFGKIRMSNVIMNLLTEFDGQQATLDAYMPQKWETRLPEVIINVPARDADEQPSRPNMMLTLRKGMNVRLNRQPNIGMTGIVVDLPKSPILLDNGLRVPCVQVQLVSGEMVFVPLANLEVLSR